MTIIVIRRKTPLTGHSRREGCGLVGQRRPADWSSVRACLLWFIDKDLVFFFLDVLGSLIQRKNDEALTNAMCVSTMFRRKRCCYSFFSFIEIIPKMPKF